MAKEKSATELRYRYFGPEGELYQKRQTLLKPIQDEVYNAVKGEGHRQRQHHGEDPLAEGFHVYLSPFLSGKFRHVGL